MLQKGDFVFKILRNFFLFLLLFYYLSCSVNSPLPSWNDTQVKESIIKFIDNVTRKNSNNFLPEEQRIAVFDNDGTLWQEQPVVQLEFIKERIKELAKNNKSLESSTAYNALISDNIEYLIKNPKESESLMLLPSKNISVTLYQKEVSQFLKNAIHPTLKKPYTDLSYQPMQELLNYLRKNNFKIYICSGGLVDFMRVFSENLYNIPPENVIGASQKKVFKAMEDGSFDIYLMPETISSNDMKEKPVGISNAIGRYPVFVCGNVRSNGDIEMLTYSRQHAPSFQLLINHDDDVREFAYKDSGSLKAAAEQNFHVVSMKNDWKTIFADGE